jgi:hypothetical protein
MSVSQRRELTVIAANSTESWGRRERASAALLSEPFFVNHLILESKELGEDFLLPWSFQFLLIEVGETPMISVNNEGGVLKV